MRVIWQTAFFLVVALWAVAFSACRPGESRVRELRFVVENDREANLDLGDFIDYGGTIRQDDSEKATKTRLEQLAAVRGHGFVAGGPRLVGKNHWIFYFVPPKGLNYELLLMHGAKEVQRISLDVPIGMDVTWNDDVQKFVAVSTLDEG